MRRGAGELPVATGSFGVAVGMAVAALDAGGETASAGGGAGDVSASAGEMTSFLRALARPFLSAPSGPPCGSEFLGGLVDAVAAGALSSGDGGNSGSRDVTSGRVKSGATRPSFAKSSSKLPAKGLCVWADKCPSPAKENRTARVRAPAQAQARSLFDMGLTPRHC